MIFNYRVGDSGAPLRPDRRPSNKPYEIVIWIANSGNLRKSSAAPVHRMFDLYLKAHHKGATELDYVQN